MQDDQRFIPADSPEGQELTDLYNLSWRIRGTFIEQTIWIDVMIAGILADYFAPDKERRTLLLSEVFSGAGSTFNKNIALLTKVVSHSFSAFAGQHPDLFTKLERIRRVRNNLAHARLDTSDEWMSRREKDRIQIIYYKNGKSRTEVITVEESNKLLGE
jgi:hypothetical protein